MNGAEPSDEELHVRIIAGDEEALVLIDQRYAGQVRGWMILTRGVPESEAMFYWNEALDALWSHAATVAPVGNLRNYLFRVAQNKVADYYRAPERQHDPRDVGDIRATELAPVHEAAPERPLPPGLEHCLDQLPPNHRQAVDLIVSQGMTVKDAAEVLGVTQNTAAQWKHRAVVGLRRCMDERDEP